MLADNTYADGPQAYDPYPAGGVLSSSGSPITIHEEDTDNAEPVGDELAGIEPALKSVYTQAEINRYYDDEKSINAYFPSAPIDFDASAALHPERRRCPNGCGAIIGD